MTKHVSLYLELGEVHDALSAAHELLMDDHGGGKAQLRAAFRAGAVVSLVLARMRLLRAVIGGELAPDEVMAPHNTVQPGDAEEDVLLPPPPRSHR